MDCFFNLFVSFLFLLSLYSQVDISAICKQGDVADMLFAITFTLLSGKSDKNDTTIDPSTKKSDYFDIYNKTGNIRRFRRICEHIQSQVCSKRFPGPSSPPRVSSVTTAVSESSSCGSDSSERLSCYKRQVKLSSIGTLTQNKNEKFLLFSKIKQQQRTCKAWCRFSVKFLSLPVCGVFVVGVVYIVEIFDRRDIIWEWICCFRQFVWFFFLGFAENICQYNVKFNAVLSCLFFWLQIENEIDTDTVFDCNKTNVTRRSSASTNNNNAIPTETSSSKTVRSRYVHFIQCHLYHWRILMNFVLFLFVRVIFDCSSESADQERTRDRNNGERPTTMSGSAIA